MIVIGIAGGVASGKSFVANGLKHLGAEILDADRAGHEVLREAEVKQAIRQRWGDLVFDDEGHVNRPALGRIVFAPPPAGPTELSYLEHLTHPKIGHRLRTQIEALQADSKTKAVVLDAPVMFKAGWDVFCDRIVYVDAPREMRLARAQSRGWSAEQFSAREAAQECLEQKRSRADVIIDNSASADHTLNQLKEFWNTLNLA